MSLSPVPSSFSPERGMVFWPSLKASLVTRSLDSRRGARPRGRWQGAQKGGHSGPGLWKGAAASRKGVTCPGSATLPSQPGQCRWRCVACGCWKFQSGACKRDGAGEEGFASKEVKGPWHHWGTGPWGPEEPVCTDARQGREAGRTRAGQGIRAMGPGRGAWPNDVS